MSSDIRLHDCQHDMRLLKSSGDTEVLWKSSALDGVDSAVACL